MTPNPKQVYVNIEALLKSFAVPKQKTAWFIAITYNQETKKASIVCEGDSLNLVTMQAAIACASITTVPFVVIDVYNAPQQNWTKMAYWLADQDILGHENTIAQQAIQRILGQYAIRLIDQSIKKHAKQLTV